MSPVITSIGVAVISSVVAIYYVLQAAHYIEVAVQTARGAVQ